MLLQGDVDHVGSRAGAVPMLFSGRDKDRIAGPDFTRGSAPHLHPAKAGNHVQCLSEGWLCHAVRARGSNRTKAPLIRAGAGASMIGSCQTVPVNESAGIRRDGIEPNGLISMNCPSIRYAAVLALIAAT